MPARPGRGSATARHFAPRCASSLGVGHRKSRRNVPRGTVSRSRGRGPLDRPDSPVEMNRKPSASPTHIFRRRPTAILSLAPLDCWLHVSSSQSPRVREWSRRHAACDRSRWKPDNLWLGGRPDSSPKRFRRLSLPRLRAGGVCGLYASVGASKRGDRHALRAARERP